MCGVDVVLGGLEGAREDSVVDRFFLGRTLFRMGMVSWMSLSVVGSGKVVLRLGTGAVHLALALVLSTANGLLSPTGAPCRMA